MYINFDVLPQQFFLLIIQQLETIVTQMVFVICRTALATIILALFKYFLMWCFKHIHHYFCIFYPLQCKKGSKTQGAQRYSFLSRLKIYTVYDFKAHCTPVKSMRILLLWWPITLCNFNKQKEPNRIDQRDL